MRNLSKFFLGGVALVAMVMTIACGGGGGEQTSSAPVDPELLLADPSAALGASAQRFEEQIESVEAQFSFEFGMEGFVMGADGHFAYQAPDSVHMTMEMTGGDDESFNLGELGPIEMLLLGDQVYMNTGFTGWMTMSLDDLGADADSLREMMDTHAPLDFQALVDGLNAEVQNLGSEEVGGNTYTRLRITTDLATVLDAMADSVSDDSFGAGMFDVSGPMTMDILMNPETLLPYTFEANGDFGFGGESMEFKMAFKFYDYNGPVDIPAAPEDAVPFDEGFGDLGPGQ
jgi:hypothetical protein